MQWIGCGSPQKEWKNSGKCKKTVEVDILHAVEVLPKFCNLLFRDELSGVNLPFIYGYRSTCLGDTIY